ncbi:MAG TPA: hypothetical protein VF163_16995 [Micromonosporaceae bacterium]
MAKALGLLGDRLLGLFVPKTEASACWCNTRNCVLPDGSYGHQECCKIGGTLYCEECW